MLRLYVDSADRTAAEPLLETGLFHGLTTNPTLLEDQGLRVDDLDELYEWATGAGAREVFLQAWGADTQEILESARHLAEVGPDVVVKVPATRAGASAARTLVDEGRAVLLTAVYAPVQGLVAAAAGVRYVAPYLGRMGDAGRDGARDVLAMHRTLAAVGSRTEVLVASLRSRDVLVDLALHGVPCFALSPTVAASLFDEPLTDDAVEVFESAARNASS